MPITIILKLRHISQAYIHHVLDFALCSIQLFTHLMMNILFLHYYYYNLFILQEFDQREFGHF